MTECFEKYVKKRRALGCLVVGAGDFDFYAVASESARGSEG